MNKRLRIYEYIYVYIYIYIYTSLSAVQIYDFHIFLTVYSIFCRSHSTWTLRKRKSKSLWYARVLNDNIFNVSWSENLSYSICITYHRSVVPSAVGEHHPMVPANFPPVPFNFAMSLSVTRLPNLFFSIKMESLNI